jgi:alkanesulfonate monooxygenase SsuD/methylene tetrahydromethanopterin reductase-like flavin-dependent oxidoreductase (luciferase family)
MREEFELRGVPFESRGRLTDECLAGFKELWTKGNPTYSGKYVKFSDLHFYPSPCRNRIRRCGSAARACRRWAAP